MMKPGARSPYLQWKHMILLIVLRQVASICFLRHYRRGKKTTTLSLPHFQTEEALFLASSHVINSVLILSHSSLGELWERIKNEDDCMGRSREQSSLNSGVVN
jgi:hypothetical protein